MTPKLADFQRALHLALNSHDCVLAVVLVGSSAERRAMPGSDIDLAVVVDVPPQQGEFRLDTSPVKVDLQFFDTAWLLGLRTEPFLDLRGLREAGRLSRGRVLFSRWASLSEVLEAARHVVLSPLEASLLMSRAAEELGSGSAHPGLSPARRVWELLGAGFSLAILGAALTPMRYQKPKWLARDLRAGGSQGLVQALTDLVRGCGTHEWPAQRFVRIVRERVIAACELRGLPPLQRCDGTPPNAYVCVRDAMKDAAMLLDRGDESGACLAAALGLRYAVALMEEPDLGPVAPPERVAAWMDETLACAFPPHTGIEADAYAGRIFAEGRRLERRYGRALRHAQLRSANATSRSGIPAERSALLGVTRLSERLWMGAHQADPHLLRALGISTIVLTAAELQPPDSTFAPLEVIRAPLEDGPLSPAARRSAECAADLALEKLRSGQGSVFVSCHYGLNRSALVAGYMLRRGFLWSGAKTITHLRRARRSALNNPAFAEALLEGRSAPLSA